MFGGAMLSLIVATIGRGSLVDAISSAIDRLPVAEVIIAPAPHVAIPALQVPADVRLVSPTSNLYEAWNLAVLAAKFPSVCFLNDDDCLDGPGIEPNLVQGVDILNMRLRLDGRRANTSVSARRANGRISPVDLFHANRAACINAYIWPRKFLIQMGPFDTTFRIAGDVEWMQRLVDSDLNVKWLSRLTYVQRRGKGRLSSWGENGPLIIEEAQRVVEAAARRHGNLSIVALLGRAWLGAMRIRNIPR